MNQKLTIQQIKNMIVNNVDNVVNVVKQPGTNSFFVRVLDIEDLLTAATQLSAIGFRVNDELIDLNRKTANRVIYCEFDCVGSTHYGRQIKVYGGVTQ
jgi:hypothetical protein